MAFFVDTFSRYQLLVFSKSEYVSISGYGWHLKSQRLKFSQASANEWLHISVLHPTEFFILFIEKPLNFDLSSISPFQGEWVKVMHIPTSWNTFSHLFPHRSV